MAWRELILLIEHHYTKTRKKGVRPTYPVATLLRIHLLQQGKSISHPDMKKATINAPTMRSFAGNELISDRLPDEATILTFNHKLKKHALHEQIVEIVKAQLSA